MMSSTYCNTNTLKIQKQNLQKKKNYKTSLLRWRGLAECQGSTKRKKERDSSDISTVCLEHSTLNISNERSLMTRPSLFSEKLNLIAREREREAHREAADACLVFGDLTELSCIRESCCRITPAIQHTHALLALTNFYVTAYSWISTSKKPITA